MAFQVLQCPSGCVRSWQGAGQQFCKPSSATASASTIAASRASSLKISDSSVSFRDAKYKELAHSASFSHAISSTERLHSLAGRAQGHAIAGCAARAAGLFDFFGGGKKSQEKVKMDLLSAIAPLDRGATANADDIAAVDEIAQELEKLNPTRDPLNSSLVNGKWKLIYTTSQSVLKKKRPELLRPKGPIYQAINTDTLRAQNLETWPFFNQVTADLEPLGGKKVLINFDYFKIGGLIKVKAPGRARGELEITYLDDAFRISRGDRGNLYILIMDDPDYVIPE